MADGSTVRPLPTRVAGTELGVRTPVGSPSRRCCRALVAEKLAADWSPQQIAGWLKQTFPQDPCLHVSHETIYLSLFVQSRGVLKKALNAHLRRRRRMRRSKHASTAGQCRGQIIDAVSIRERPAAAADRAVPGHWEGDLLTGARTSHIATLVERHSRFLLLIRLAGKDTANVVRALAQSRSHAPEGVDGVSDVGPWDRIRLAQALHGRHEREGGLLRPAESMAARCEREHHRLVAAILPQRNNPLDLHAGRSQHHRATSQLTSTPDAGICHAS